MEKHHPYNSIIEDKLEYLPGANVDQLWNGMHAILDKEMPQKEDRRRFPGWILTAKGLLVLAAVCFLPIFYLTINSLVTSKTTSINKSSDQHTVSSTTSGTPIYSEVNKEVISNLATVNPVQNKDDQKEHAITESSAPDYQTSIVKFSTPAFGVKQMANNQRAKARNPYMSNTPSEDLSKDRINMTAHTVPGAAGLPEQQQYAFADGSMYTISVSKSSPNVARSIPSILLADSMAVTGSVPLKSLFGRPQGAAAALGLEEEEHGPYIGLLAGVDLSSIHFNSMKTGANKGLIAGYSFTKRWSIESGLFWNTKRFLGNGSYFRPDNYTLPAGVNMLTVSGKNELYEWPVNIKYTVLIQKHGLFVTAGVSSYYMKRESYDYEYEQNGVTGKSYSSYKNETKNWFSVVNFSLGYTYKIGTSGNIRVEPYVKLPIKDLGINNMPVMSTGLNVGFTKQFFK